MSEHNPTADQGEPTTIEAEPHEVLDPSEFNQNQRLKDIHAARRKVRERVAELPRHGTTKEHYSAHLALADAVATYGYELLPLLEDTGYDLTDDRIEESQNFVWPSVQSFIISMGQIPPDADYPSEYPMRQHSMMVYHSLNRFMRSIGLGTDFDDGGDEWEIET
jgi:hypothetical protein